MTDKLVDQLRDAVNSFKFNGHRSEEDQRLAACKRNIDEAESGLQKTTLDAARRGKESIRLMTMRGGCVASKGDFRSDSHIKCDQCLAFKKRLEDHGLVVELGEDKHCFFLMISWKREV